MLGGEENWIRNIKKQSIHPLVIDSVRRASLMALSLATLPSTESWSRLTKHCERIEFQILWNYHIILYNGKTTIHVYLIISFYFLQGHTFIRFLPKLLQLRLESFQPLLIVFSEKSALSTLPLPKPCKLFGLEQDLQLFDFGGRSAQLLLDSGNGMLGCFKPAWEKSTPVSRKSRRSHSNFETWRGETAESRSRYPIWLPFLGRQWAGRVQRSIVAWFLQAVTSGSFRLTKGLKEWYVQRTFLRIVKSNLIL